MFTGIFVLCVLVKMPKIFIIGILSVFVSIVNFRI